MIKTLLIKNFALISNLEIFFTPGLNIVTGESGAGKTILVNAINQLCGERSKTEFVKDNQEKAVIEGEFDIGNHEKIKRILTDENIDIFNDTLIIRKEIRNEGNSRIFINDSPVSLNILNLVSSYLIDLHGQHQHQRLLHPENHLDYLDAFAGIDNVRLEFESAYMEYHNILKKEKELREKQTNMLQLKDLYTFQINEIEKADIDIDQINEFQNEIKILNNYEKIHSLTSRILENFFNAEINMSALLSDSEKQLSDLAYYDQEFKPLLENYGQARQLIDDIGQQMERFFNNLEFDAEKAEFIRQKLAQYDFLLKKYQKENFSDLLSFYNDTKKNLQELENFDFYLSEIIKEKEMSIIKVIDLAANLSKKRKDSAYIFEENLNLFLKEIGMPSARFEIIQEQKSEPGSVFVISDNPIKMTSSGYDFITFSFSPNPGEEVMPINKIASGGELSRIMLALKSVLAAKDGVPVLVFDEIDSGISGKIAQLVGIKIHSLSAFHQLICITHLPQIAAFADNHLRVEKSTSDSTTEISVKVLSKAERINDLALLLGGISITNEALDNARRLLEEAHQVK